MAYRFKVGQSVYTFGHGDREVYIIVRLLPSLPNGEAQYQIKAVGSGVQRVVREVEIRPA